MKNNIPIERSDLLNYSDYDIIDRYQSVYKGYCQYYKIARNQNRLAYFKWILETSMVKTLARKFKTTVPKIYKQYGSKFTYNNYTYKTLSTSKNVNNKTKVARFGGIPLSCGRNNSIIDRMFF